MLPNHTGRRDVTAANTAGDFSHLRVAAFEGKT